ncbi:LysE family translocator [Pelagibacterium halotolerans]|uniref:LysE family translocator n=1 Tax=Pelagibacterium halotolerans TaxID=531813 RepID=UPI00384EBA5D
MDFWLLFCSSVFLVSVVPGPSTLIAFTHGARFGLSKALATALGNATASVLQAAAASAGLGVLLAQSASLLLAVKYLGAAYLIYLGIRMWRSPTDRVNVRSGASYGPPVPRWMFRDGFLVAASNPKAILFFTALFPQFLGNSEAVLGRMVVMSALVGVTAFAVAALYAGLGARICAMHITQRIMQRLHKAVGGLFVFAGIGIVVRD